MLWPNTADWHVATTSKPNHVSHEERATPRENTEMKKLTRLARILLSASLTAPLLARQEPPFQVLSTIERTNNRRPFRRPRQRRKAPSLADGRQHRIFLFRIVSRARGRPPDILRLHARLPGASQHVPWPESVSKIKSQNPQSIASV
jgi:hypothetical protein